VPRVGKVLGSNGADENQPLMMGFKGRRLSWLTNFCRNAIGEFISVKRLIGGWLTFG
jgi:hypothetical protein